MATRTNFTSYRRGTCGIYFIRAAYILPFNFMIPQLGSLEKLVFYYICVAAISLFEFLVIGYAILHFDRSTLDLRRRGECRGFVVEAGTMWLCAMITHRDRVRVDRAKFTFGLVSLMPQLE